MMTKKSLLLRVLSDLVTVVENSTEEELAALRTLSVSKLGASKGKTKSHSSGTDRKTRIGDLEAQRILERLISSDSREEALNVLAKRDLSKPSLEFLARSLDLPVVREDNSERLIQKIVEGAIGSRLNALAIRGA